jgi:hypothetical protein
MSFFKLLLLLTFAIASAELLSNILPLRRRASLLEPLTASFGGFMFDVEVMFGNQTFQLLLDTGSSDVWVVATGYLCINATDNTELPESACNYGKTYSTSSTFVNISSETFGIEYGAGIAVGILGSEDVTLGGVTVKQQTVGIVQSATIPGSGIDSGILGLGYPSLTSGHAGTTLNDTLSLLSNRTTYNPILTSMYKQGSIEPWFSIALERLDINSTTGAGGYLGLGKLPPVSLSSSFVVVPVEITESLPASFTNGTVEITEWTLGIEAVTWGTDGNMTSNTSRFQAVVDTGNYFNVLPPDIVEQIHDSFEPPGKYDATTHQYVVDCDATVPKLGIQIGNQTFFHKPEDLVFHNPNGSCVTTLLPTVGGDGVMLNFLGDTFMKNVVSVFDFGVNEMRFAARTDGGGSFVVVSGNSTVVPNGSWRVSRTVALGAFVSASTMLLQLVAFL